MTDLFAHHPTPPPKRNCGYGNGTFLADLAEGMPDEAMRLKLTTGEYPDLNRRYIAFWRRMVGRTTKGAK